MKSVKDSSIHYIEGYTRQAMSPAPSPPLPLYGYSVYKMVLINGRKNGGPGMKHCYIDLIFTVSGAGTITLFNQEFPQKPGSVFIYYPGEEHHRVADSDLWTIRCLAIDGPLSMPILTSFNYPRHIQMPLAFSQAKLDEIERSITETSPYGIRKTTALILELLSYPGEESSEHENPQELIQAAIRYISDNLSNSALDVNAIADYLGVHRSTFSRLFKRQMDRTPRFYIHMVRMNQAKALLVSTGTSIARISEICGFHDVTTFCRRFKQHMYVTPSQYRASGGGGTVAPETEKSAGEFLAPRTLKVGKKK